MVLLSFVLTSCNSEVKTETAEFFVFDTVVDITAYGENAKEAIEAARDELYRYDALLSTTKGNSDIYKVNNNESREVSTETADIIEKSLKISELTDGALDITIYPVVELWGFTGGNYRVPSESEIEEALNFVGFDKISLQGNNVVKEDTKVQIDLGATAKGYIGDKIAEAIKNAGCNSAVLSIGGNVVTVGTKPDGKDFNVGITWADGKEICATVSLKDMSAVTSGTYQRNFTENGLIADGLSTAFFVMGSEKVVEFYESEKYSELGTDSLDFMIIKNDGTCIVTENIYSNMKLNSDCISESDVTVI